MTGPYGSAAQAYWQAGWHGPLPLPTKRKEHPPSGYTGAGGQWPSFADVFAWCEEKPDGNIGLRMPPHIVGIDVDAYGDKLGAQTMALHESMYGPLPPTWRSSARNDGVSGIQFFRVPEGLAWPGELTGGGVEIIQMRHRYAVVHPSVHPITGETYRWITPDGLVSTAVPEVDALPVLPQAWVTGLTGDAVAGDVLRNSATYDEAIAYVADHPGSQDAPCARMDKAIGDAVSELEVGGDGHPVGRDAALRIVRLAVEHHTGGLAGLVRVRAAFLANVCDPQRAFLGKNVRSKNEAAYEWAELVASAAGLVSANHNGIATCDCHGQLTARLMGTGKAGGGDREEENRESAGESAGESGSDAPGADSSGVHFTSAADFLFNIPDVVARWGTTGTDVLWADRESLMLVGPPGVGKSTLAGQLIRALCGLQDEVLGQPVKPAGRVLYLAMDRPAQIRRALARTFAGDDPAVVDERLVFWEGPPPGDIAKYPGILAAMAEQAGADVVVLDSVKDAAVGLSDEEVAAGYQRARNTLLHGGVDLLELHHMVKRGVGGAKPTELADVYGSVWLTAGAGSVLLLWGSAGDPVVEARHLKQPLGEFGPVKVLHDHDTGTSEVFESGDVYGIVAASGDGGMTPRDLARVLYGTSDPSDSHLVRARRKLTALADRGVLERNDKLRDGRVGSTPQSVYRVPPNARTPPEHRNFGDNSEQSEQPPNNDGVCAGQRANRTPEQGEHPRPPNNAPSLNSEGVGVAVDSDADSDPDLQSAIRALRDAGMLADRPEDET